MHRRMPSGLSMAVGALIALPALGVGLPAPDTPDRMVLAAVVDPADPADPAGPGDPGDPGPDGPAPDGAPAPDGPGLGGDFDPLNPPDLELPSGESSHHKLPKITKLPKVPHIPKHKTHHSAS